MIPGTQPDSYVNGEALTKSPAVWQIFGKAFAFITHFLHTAVFIWIQKQMLPRRLITFPVSLTKDTSSGTTQAGYALHLQVKHDKSCLLQE